MTYSDSFGRWHAADTEAQTGTNPPKKRVTPPLLMGDILTSRRGVPVFVEEWLRLERERDERRRAKEALK